MNIILLHNIYILGNQIYMEDNINIAYLSFGHLCCCANCAPAMSKCPICRAFVKGTVKTFPAWMTFFTNVCYKDICIITTIHVYVKKAYLSIYFIHSFRKTLLIFLQLNSKHISICLVCLIVLTFLEQFKYIWLLVFRVHFHELYAIVCNFNVFNRMIKLDTILLRAIFRPIFE